MANPTPPVPPMIVETAVSNDGEEVDLNPSGELPVPNGTTQPNPKPAVKKPGPPAPSPPDRAPRSIFLFTLDSKFRNR